MIERVFLGWDGPALPRAATVLMDHYGDRDIEGPVARLDGALVAVPGGRAGRRLKELLVAEGQRRGQAVIPPRIATMGAVPELLYEEALPVADPAVARRVWAEVLAGTDPEALTAVFARRPAPDALAEWARLGREVHGLQADVAAGGYRFGDVATRCSDVPLFDDRGRWRVLAGVQSAYEARLAELGLADRDLVRLDALDRGAVRLDRELWLVGVAEMPGVLRRFVAGAAESPLPVRTLVHAPEERAEAFDELGCVRTEVWLDAEIPLDEARLHVVDQPQDQADTVGRCLRALDARYTADEIVVGVPDRTVVPLLEQRLENAGVPTRDAAGTPLARTAPFKLLQAVAEFLDGRRFEALAALARHPDLDRWLAEADPDGGWSPGREDATPDLAAASVLGALDAYHNEHLQSRVPRGDGLLPGARGSGDGEVVALLVGRLDGVLLDDLHGRDRLSKWAAAVLELLATVFGTRELRSDRPSHRRLARSLRLLGRAARSFLGLPEPLDVGCSAPDAVRLILDEATGDTVPADADWASVELLGWLELHLDDAPVTLVTGVNEPYLPESVSDHAFLPNGLRRVLGLLDNDRRYARDAYQLTAMLHARPHLELVTGRRTEAGDPVRPSRLLFAADPKVVARRVRTFYDEEYDAGGDGTAVVASTEGGAGAPDGTGTSRFQLPPERVISAPEPFTRLRATDFRALIADPYGFALDRIMGLESVDDAAREMDGLRFGSLAHTVLERFGRSDAANVGDADGARARLDELMDEEVQKRFGSNAYVAARVQVDQLRARLHAFADWHTEWIGKGWRVVAVECSTPKGGVPLDVDGEPFGISARIDRVDYHEGRGEWAVFDYKTGDRGRNPEDTHLQNRGREWADLQLPLYHWILPQLTDADGSLIAPDAAAANTKVGYIVLPRELKDVGGQLAPWSEAALAEALDRARALIRQVRENTFVYEPGSRPSYPDPPLEALLGLGQLATGTAEGS